MVEALGRRGRALALFVATVALTVGAVLPQTAAADPIGDKQAQANAIAAKVDELNHTIERYAEQANGAQVELDGLNQQEADAQARVDAAKAEQAQHLSELRTYAIDAYVHGTDDHAAALASSTDLTDLGQRQGYLSAASGNRQQLVDQLRATQQDLAAQIAQLNDAQAKVAAKQKDLNDRRTAAASAAAQQRDLLAQAKGELATLVAQAQAKKAADEAAAAQARARSAASSSGGSGNFGPVPGVRGGAGAAIAEARRQLGKPYAWGAAGPDSFDCSGLTMWAWRAGGVSLPHYTGAQYSATTHIPLSALQPGDLIFFNGMEHVGLYVGGGQMIHAPHSGTVVQYESIYYWNTSMVASRP
ncbi:MAG TPA: NlpC/P60 family protein [Acidimicrobiales bacterium]|jgi:cell wall-associated NlpC family hydrolase|nr:NlpC/P60 family protein [Acidimicrobiales bacterium]